MTQDNRRFEWTETNAFASTELTGMSDFGEHGTLKSAGRDPEDRVILRDDRSQVREKMFDKTLADSFPASDPPSSTPRSGGRRFVFSRITMKEDQTHDQHRTTT